MAKTQTIEISEEMQSLFDKNLERRDRFILGVLQSHKRSISRSTKDRLKSQSLFKFLSSFWSELSTAEKETWAEAGDVTGLSNWQLFISDNAARLRHDLTFPVSPSDKWQVNAGTLTIEDPATEIILKQNHPLDYWVTQKITGKPWKQELVLVRESFALPLTLRIRYKADLTAVGSNQVARYRAEIWSSYQGQDIYTDLTIDFNPDIDWTLVEVTQSSVLGHIMGYTLFLEIEGYRGRLLFDNIESEHSSQNWARDPRCHNISRNFTGAFAVVPPFWIPVSLPSGAFFSSFYPPSL